MSRFFALGWLKTAKAPLNRPSKSGRAGKGLRPARFTPRLEILEDRHGRGSTMVTSQLPVEHWHEIVGDPTIADAILDRLVHNAHRLILKGESLRKAAAKRQKLDAEPVE